MVVFGDALRRHVGDQHPLQILKLEKPGTPSNHYAPRLSLAQLQSFSPSYSQHSERAAGVEKQKSGHATPSNYALARTRNFYACSVYDSHRSFCGLRERLE
ncbi:uncharacterized protein N7529_007515 [Penicillium soppii]|uniref:uncharacterized protein n=1 Tax=Penicillium soppii TaxID=69789 RepID=UPI002548CDD9|nr:uncharacterized protein N7529_007515 [Penicillium soppii]KAJ5860205.1 hypothetical protein N7529_007515 [Penicillium soppii]